MKTLLKGFHENPEKVLSQGHHKNLFKTFLKTFYFNSVSPKFQRYIQQNSMLKPIALGARCLSDGLRVENHRSRFEKVTPTF